MSILQTPVPKSDEEIFKRLKKLMEAGDAHGLYNLGYAYDRGIKGITQDHDKAMELYHRAGELGYAEAYFNIGIAYDNGRGVERNEKKADHYFELAAMGGISEARHNLGCSEANAGNWDRALKHFMIAAGSGYNDSVKGIQQLYLDGNATKEDYAKALRAYQQYLDEIRSDQRDKAAAFDDRYICY